MPSSKSRLLALKPNSSRLTVLSLLWLTCFASRSNQCDNDEEWQKEVLDMCDLELLMFCGLKSWLDKFKYEPAKKFSVGHDMSKANEILDNEQGFPIQCSALLTLKLAIRGFVEANVRKLEAEKKEKTLVHAAANTAASETDKKALMSIQENRMTPFDIFRLLARVDKTKAMAGNKAAEEANELQPYFEYNLGTWMPMMAPEQVDQLKEKAEMLLGKAEAEGLTLKSLENLVNLMNVLRNYYDNALNLVCSSHVPAIAMMEKELPRLASSASVSLERGWIGYCKMLRRDVLQKLASGHAIWSTFALFDDTKATAHADLQMLNEAAAVINQEILDHKTQVEITTQMAKTCARSLIDWEKRTKDIHPNMDVGKVAQGAIAIAKARLESAPWYRRAVATLEQAVKSTTVQEKKELQEQKGKLASALAVGVVEDFVAGNVIKGSVAPEEADKVSEHIISQPGLVDSLAARMQTLFGGTQKPVRVTRTQLATMRGPTKNEDGTPRKYSRFRATGHSRYTAAEVDEEPRVDVNQILMSPTNRGKQGGNLFDLESPDPRGPTSAEFGHDEHAEIKLPSPDTVMEEVQPILQDALWNALKEDDDAHENNYNHQEENEKTSPMSLNKNEQMAAMSFAAPRKNMAEGEAHPSRNGHSRASRSSYAHYQAGRKNNDNFGRGAGAGGRAGGRASSIGTKPQFMFMSDPATGPQRFGQDSTERSVQLEANKAKQQHQPERVLSAELISGAFQRFLDAAERLEKQVSAHRALRKVSKLGRIDVQPGIESKSKLSSTDDDGEDESVEKSQDDDVDAPAISTKYPEQKNGVGEREDGLASSHKTSSTNREQADHDHQEDGDEPGGFFAVLEQSSKSSTNSVRSTRASKNIKIESSKQHHSSSAVPLAGDLHRGHSSTATSTSSSRSFEVEDGAGAAAAEQTANAARLGKPSKEQKDYLRNRTDDKKRHFDKDCLSTAGAPSAAAVDASRPVATHLSATTGETKSGMRTTVEVSSPASCSNVQDLMSTSAFTSDMLKDILARSVVATTTPSPDKESRGAVERTSQREPLTSSVSLSAPRLGELRPQPLRADDDRRLSSYQDALAHAAHQQQSQQLLGHDVTLDNQTRMIDGLGHGGPPRGADHSSSGHVSRVSLSASSSATQPAVVEIIRTSQEHQMTYNDVTYNSYSTRSKNAGDEHGSSAAPLREISSTSSSSSAVLDELNAHVAAGGVVQPRIGEPSGSDLLPRARPDTSSGSSVFQHSAHAGSGGALSGAIATTAGPSTMASSNIVSTSIATPPSDHHPWGSAPSAGATGVEDHAWLSSYRSATATASSSTTIGGIGNMSTNTTSTNPLLQKASTMRSLFLQRPGMTRPGPTSSSLSENADRNQQVVQQQQQANAMMSRTIDTGAAGGAPVFRPPRIGAVAADNKPMRPTALR
ncbi:unnamed protein product [Amoebophrya sp. A25]|nr:unnamed protein product [Amoebophrya sp. A25]|eukprot:GSA25T00019216001.1